MGKLSELSASSLGSHDCHFTYPNWQSSTKPRFPKYLDSDT